ncbi:uncharacterized protein LOC116143125 isoform X3 [Pistacia vera]|uniref:uncharacterized protein LOC116143125 isoform X3 n=1 Tax=Pistacia vera TaxID=55513 RepID=UPI001263BEBF|nr:uncharacterized protein LOC116143125 isoform X3 [Pistacia vera]
MWVCFLFSINGDYWDQNEFFMCFLFASFNSGAVTRFSFMFRFGFLKMAMKILSGSCSSDFSSLFRGAFYINRTRLTSPEEVFFCQGIGFSTDSRANESFNTRVEPPSLLAAKRKEAKSVLTLFLMQQGLSKAVAARTVNKSDHFIDHLISRLHSSHKSWKRAHSS